MQEEGWAGDPTDQPWWAFFLLLGGCAAVAVIFAAVFELISLYSRSFAVLSVSFLVGALVYGIKRTMRWMYGPNLGRADSYTEPHATKDDGPF